MKQLMLIVCVVLGSFASVSFARTSESQHQSIETTPTIQLALLLDTSGSMDGLIDQARNQLWQVVNQFANVSKAGVRPRLEVALFEYGNDRLSAQSGYIRQVTPLTTELDRVSEGLFTLTTSGGSEYCGQVIDTAVNQLQWTQRQGDIRMVLIAGNEPFSQGPVPFKHAIVGAQQRDIVVNTIFAGAAEQGISLGWREGARLAGGEYMSIDQNQKVVHINAPQDEQIAALNQQLNQTYLPYGSEGKVAAQRQAEQDSQSGNISAGLLAKRAKSKASGFYRNESWDLVDAVAEKDVAVAELAEESVPEPMKPMSVEQREQFVAEKAAERKRLQQRIVELTEARDAYVAKVRSEMVQQNTMDEALTAAIKKQVKRKDYRLEPL